MSSLGDWPVDLLPYRWDFYLQPNTRSFLSPVTRTRQVLAGQGPRWIGTGSFRFKTRRKEQRFEALLDKLQGQVNTVDVWDFAHKFGLPLGPAIDLSSIGITQFTDGGSPEELTAFTDGGSPDVEITYFTGSAAGFTVYGNWAIGAETVTITGFPQGTTQLYAGDYVELVGYLYRLTEDATANGLNRASLSLNRPLVAAVAHEATVVTTRARTPMQLLDDDQSRRSVDVDHVREYTISLVEVLPI